MTQVISWDEHRKDDAALGRLADALAGGKIVAFPTETVYGIGALENQPAALQTIAEFKGRPEGKPFAYYIYAIECLERYRLVLPPFFAAFASAFLPGPVTVILATHDGVRYGIRYPDVPLLLELLRRLPCLLKGTSANVSGEKSLTTAQEVYRQFKDKIDILVDGGVCKYRQDSTVVDLSVSPCMLVRAGMYADKISAFFTKQGIAWCRKKHLLVVCTGNTCRSPMAHGWLLHRFAQSAETAHYTVASCGIYAPFSMPPSPDAVELLKTVGVDIASFRSKTMTRAMIDEADKIVVMSSEHAEAVVSLNSVAREKLCVLDVPDPLGRGKSVYAATFEQIKKRIEEHWSWIVG